MIANLDILINNLIIPLRTAGLNEFFFAISYLGNAYFLLAVIFLLLIFFYSKKNWRYLRPLIYAASGSALYSYLIKLAVLRPRPDYSVYIEPGYSFPSLHATLAVAVYGFIVFYCRQKVRRKKIKKLLIILNLSLILLIGFSRIYLGVHYFSDVLAGYALGAVWLISGILTAKPRFLSANRCETAAPKFRPRSRHRD